MSAMHYRRVATAVAATVAAAGLVGITATSALASTGRSATGHPATTQEFRRYGATMFQAANFAFTAAETAGYTKAECTLIYDDNSTDGSPWYAIVSCTN